MHGRTRLGQLAGNGIGDAFSIGHTKDQDVFSGELKKIIHYSLLTGYVRS